MVLSFKLISTFDISLPRYVFQFLLVFFPKVADQVLTEQVEKHDLDHVEGKDGDEDD